MVSFRPWTRAPRHAHPLHPQARRPIAATVGCATGCWKGGTGSALCGRNSKRIRTTTAFPLSVRCRVLRHMDAMAVRRDTDWGSGPRRGPSLDTRANRCGTCASALRARILNDTMIPSLWAASRCTERSTTLSLRRKAQEAQRRQQRRQQLHQAEGEELAEKNAKDAAKIHVRGAAKNHARGGAKNHAKNAGHVEEGKSKIERLIGRN